MKVCTCQFCGTTAKFEWELGKLPSCTSCGAVFNADDVYDEDDENYDDEYDEEYNVEEVGKPINVVGTHKSDDIVDVFDLIAKMITGAVLIAVVFLTFWELKTSRNKAGLEVISPTQETYMTDVVYETEINGEKMTIIDRVVYESFDEEKYELVGNLCEDENGNITATYALVERTNY